MKCQAILSGKINIYESAHNKTYNKTCATSKDSDQTAHPRSLIRVFADHMCLLQPPGYPKRDEKEPLPYWVHVQADLSLCRFCRALGHIYIYTGISYLGLFRYKSLKVDPKSVVSTECIDYIEKLPFMVNFLYNLYIFVWIQHSRLAKTVFTLDTSNIVIKGLYCLFVCLKWA